MDFESRIEAMDISLFDAIESGTSVEDRRVLLALQRAVRNLYGEYVFLEIGSHLGGSLQSHVVDPRCKKIFSIDKRPEAQPDERGVSFPYPDNSTQRMLDLLKGFAAEHMHKLVCFDEDAADINPAKIEPRPQFCFIDGEHTNRAVVSDFEFCYSVCAPNAIIAFHDANIVQGGIQAVVQWLKDEGAVFKAGLAGGVVYVIGLGDSGILNEPDAPSPTHKSASAPSAGGWVLEPDVKTLGEMMRAVTADPEGAREKGRRASEYVRKNLTWANAAEKARARLEALQKKPVRRFQNRSVDSPDLSAQISEMPRSGAFHELGVEDAQGRSEQVDLVVLPGEGKQVASTRSLERFSGCGFRELTVGIGVEGPAAALNGVLGDVQGTYLALVRSDVVGTEDWLARLVEHMEARPELAMLAPCLPEGAGEQRVKARYRSLKKELQKFARGQHQRQKGEVHPVDVLSPTCVLIRTSVLGSLGGVDASFRSPAFVLDLARRCRQQGGIVACAMDTFVHCDLVEMGEVETREGEAVGHLEAGDVHRAAGEHEASIVCYRSALEAKPDYMEVVLVLSSALLEAGRGKEAVGLFREMESRHPDSSRVKNYLGRCLFQAGEVADARRCFEMAIEIDDTFSEAYSNLGVLLWEAGELDGALARLKRAAELTPQHPDVVYNIAMIYAQLGQARQAIRMLQSYLDLQGDDLNARVYLAVLLLENEAEADGLTQLEYVMEREPEHEEALKVVAKLREGMDEGESDTTQAEE